MAKGKNLGKSIVLLFLIIILCLGGLLWFDYLGIIHAKALFTPLYRMLGASDVDDSRSPAQQRYRSGSHRQTA